MKAFNIVNQLGNMRNVLIPLFLMIIFSTPVLADTTNFCQDNTTLIKISTTLINVPELGVSRTFNVTENFTCPYGCDLNNNICYAAPSHNWMIAGIAMLVIIVGLYFIYLIFGRR